MCILNCAVTVRINPSFSRLSPILKNSVRNSNNRYPVHLDSFKETPLNEDLKTQGRSAPFFSGKLVRLSALQLFDHVQPFADAVPDVHE